MDLIYFILTAYGLTQLLCYGKIFGKIRPEGYLAGMRAGSATKRRLGGLFDRPSPQDNISKGDYDKFRYKIAREIIKLTKQMK